MVGSGCCRRSVFCASPAASQPSYFRRSLATLRRGRSRRAAAGERAMERDQEAANEGEATYYLEWVSSYLAD